MRNIGKLTRRFLGILALSTFLLLLVNFVLLLIIAGSTTPGRGPWTTAGETEAALERDGGGYVLSDEMDRNLKSQNAWAMYIDNDTMKVVWHTEDLPAEIPMKYTLTDISDITRGYLMDYPTYTAGSDEGLVVVGFPKDRYWKHMSPSWDYDFIKNSPYIALAVIGANIGIIFVIYMTANYRLLKSVKPIAEGIQSLPTKEAVCVKEKGLLSDLAKDINRTAEILESQRRDIKKKETARSGWISGVSHDIRTPLSMVMGYAGQMEEDPGMTEDVRRKAALIRRQSVKIKDLVNDLNLASKLEYNMQPLRIEQVNLVAVARQCAADFINSDLKGEYPLEWKTAEDLTSCMTEGDGELLKRAVGNLLNNVRAHNPGGCGIAVEVYREGTKCFIVVEDSGAGITEEEMDRLKNTPHYMMNDDGTKEPRHGLGILIVRQIIRAHGGEVSFTAAEPHGLKVMMRLPLCE